MKPRLLTVLMLLAVSCTVILSSCGRPRGCTDPSAFTYDSDAERDNGTCLYQRSFWDDHDTTGWIDVWVAASDSIGAVMIYEGRIDYFHSSTPNCNDPSLIWTARRPGTYFYETENDRGNISTGWLPYREEACRLFEVNYEQ